METDDPDAVEVVEPLPEGDLLYLVRFDGSGGPGLTAPVARFVDGGLAPLALPDSLDENYRARFDSAFFAPGTELRLHAGGRRIGTMILDGPAGGATPQCPGLGRGSPLLLPGATVPEFAFAFGRDGPDGPAGRYTVGVVDNRMRTFGPVLAENLLRRGGENRPYLAQRAAMRPVPWSGDERPAMAATYLVNDRLDGDPPTGAAASLFVLARFDGRQYSPEWWEVRRYRGAEEREAFVYLGAMAGPEGRIDFATRHDGVSVGLVASVDDDDRDIDWVEDGPCRAIERLERSVAATEPTSGIPAGGALD